MIPKIIHYCWFSGDKKPQTIRRCVDSWKRIMPDYTIKCWDSNSFDFDSVSFVREAMNVKQYAAASDYVRLYALYTEGGIYFDSDVMVYKPFDELLDNQFFCGTEAFEVEHEVHYRMEAAIMGAQKNMPFVKECMSYYENNNFIKKDGAYDNSSKVMPDVISEAGERHGYVRENKLQKKSNGITVYPTSFFSNSICFDASNSENLYAIHLNSGSWINYKGRGKLFHFCRKHDLMHLYHCIERLRS